jgi:hypothetical protein
MIATRELRFDSYWSHGEERGCSFILDRELYQVCYHSKKSGVMDLDAAILALAEQLQARMNRDLDLRFELDAADATAAAKDKK